MVKRDTFTLQPLQVVRNIDRFFESLYARVGPGILFEHVHVVQIKSED